MKKLLNLLNKIVSRNRKLLANNFGGWGSTSGTELFVFFQLGSTLPTIRQLFSPSEHKFLAPFKNVVATHVFKLVDDISDIHKVCLEGDKIMAEKSEDYFCHIVIPCKDVQKSKFFFEKVFGWKVQKQPGTSCCWDVLSPSGKGVSAELNTEEEVVVPSIHTSDIDAKLELVQKFGGKKLTDKTPIGENAEYGHYALFEDPNGNKMVLYCEK